MDVRTTQASVGTAEQDAALLMLRDKPAQAARHAGEVIEVMKDTTRAAL